MPPFFLLDIKNGGGNLNIDDLIKKVGSIYKSVGWKKGITHIRFPRFKGVEENALVKFEYPITALVGPNGVGKTSVLHALYGAPHGNTTAKFWFETALDKIDGPKKNPQRFIYGHFNESYGAIVETRKARIGNSRDYDYWEPYRLSTSDGMEQLPDGEYEGKSKDRWNPIKKKVVYINSKLSFGSFDRYFSSDTDMGQGQRKKEMLKQAERLKQIVDKDLKTFKISNSKERLFSNRILNPEELKAVNEILGKNYISARYIEHSIYHGGKTRDVSVIFQSGISYSEAYAGSGEVAVVSMVVKLMAADPETLVLIDEPETSLHPKAQRGVLKFLLNQIKVKKHQIVVSTHSADFVEGLPDEAICLFEDNGAGKARILNGCSPLVALNRLGRIPKGKFRILVEDPLAELLVRRAICGLDEAERGVVDVRVAPGGAEAIASHHGPHALITNDDICVLLDGDKKIVDGFTDPDDIAPSKISSVVEIIKSELGCEPKFLLPGGADADGIRARRQDYAVRYLRWIGSRIRYIPKLCPEQVIIDYIESSVGGGGNTSEKCKSYFRNLVLNGAEIKLTPQEFIGNAKVLIWRMPLDNCDLVSIRNCVKVWIDERSSLL